MLTALYFDGKTASAQQVSLSLENQDWLLRGADFELRWPQDKTQLSERLGNTPRLLTFAEGGHCEITDHAALESLLKNLATRPSWMDGMQHSRLWAILSIILILLTFISAYRYLLPWGAEVIAMRVPGVVLQKMGSSTLETLDRVMFLQPSKLPPARQKEISDAYARLKPLPDAKLQYHIVFRSSYDMGANAFALPDGNIVMLDDMVALTHDNNEIVAVLAHERGHVERRHAMRMVLQSSVIGLVLAWYVGDVSSLLSTVPAVVAQANYSRDMENEADEYAARTLRHNALSPCLLASSLRKLETAHQPEIKPASETKALDYLSSHPATQERIARLCPSK